LNGREEEEGELADPEITAQVLTKEEFVARKCPCIGNGIALVTDDPRLKRCSIHF